MQPWNRRIAWPSPTQNPGPNNHEQRTIVVVLNHYILGAFFFCINEPALASLPYSFTICEQSAGGISFAQIPWWAQSKTAEYVNQSHTIT